MIANKAIEMLVLIVITTGPQRESYADAHTHTLPSGV